METFLRWVFDTPFLTTDALTLRELMKFHESEIYAILAFGMGCCLLDLYKAWKRK